MSISHAAKLNDTALGVRIGYDPVGEAPQFHIVART